MCIEDSKRYTYDRNIVIDQVAKLRGKKRSKEYISNKVLAEKLGYSETQVKDWFNKKENVDIPLKCLVEMANILRCDIDFLLGRIDLPTKELTDIHKQTGLDEESIDILSNSWSFATPTYIFDENGDYIDEEGNKYIKDYSYYDESEEAFLKLINRIIQSHTLDNYLSTLDDLPNNYFPISHMSEYIAQSIRYHNFKNDPLFKTLAYIEEGVHRNKYDSIADGLKLVEGYTDEMIEKIRPLIWEYQELTGFNKLKRYNRIDIQDAVSRFLTSDFFSNLGIDNREEGKENG